MYQYSKYIAKHLVHSTLLITFSLTSIVWLTQALRFVDFIVNQGVSIMIFLRLTVLLLPSLILMVLPPALFCSVLFVYNKLKQESELVVMQSIGLSRWRLAVPALQVAGAVTLIAYVIALYLLPVSYTRFKEMQSFLRNNYVSILLQEGVFSTPVDGLTVFIRERQPDGTLKGILVHDNRRAEAPITFLAEEGQLMQTSQGPSFKMINGNRQEMQHGRLSFLSFKESQFNIDLYTRSMTARNRDAQELFVTELFRADERVSAPEQMKRRAEGHQRLAWPLYPLCLTMVALAVILSGEFNRRGAWHRIVLAVGFGTVIMFSAVGFRGMTALHPMMVIAVYLNLLLPMLLSWRVLAERFGGPFFSKKEEAFA